MLWVVVGYSFFFFSVIMAVVGTTAVAVAVQAATAEIVAVQTAVTMIAAVEIAVARMTVDVPVADLDVKATTIVTA